MRHALIPALFIFLPGCSLLPETTIIETRMVICPVVEVDLYCLENKDREKAVIFFTKETEIRAEARQQCLDRFSTE